VISEPPFCIFEITNFYWDEAIFFGSAFHINRSLKLLYKEYCFCKIIIMPTSVKMDKRHIDLFFLLNSSVNLLSQTSRTVKPHYLSLSQHYFISGSRISSPPFLFGPNTKFPKPTDQNILTRLQGLFDKFD